MRTLGIDLGKRGGLVLLAEDGALLGWARTPLAGKDYDGFEMAAKLRWALDQCADSPLRAFVESPNVMKLYPTAAFQVGMGFGRWIQALEAAQIGYRVVAASTWTSMFLPTKRKGWTRPQRKEFLVQQARRLCPPGIPWDALNKEARSGVADALLLAEYGRRVG